MKIAVLFNTERAVRLVRLLLQQLNSWSAGQMVKRISDERLLSSYHSCTGTCILVKHYQVRPLRFMTSLCALSAAAAVKE
jgi:hypothetical protein